MWLFKHKFHDGGTLSRYKARLIANGSSQQHGVDFDKTFSPVVKPATIRMTLSLAVSHDIIFTASSTALLQELIDSLHREFYMTDLGALNYFLGISVVRHSKGLHLYASSTTSLVGYTDADWAGCPSTCRSTSGYYVCLGDNLLSWSAKRQHTLSRFNAEAEYQGVANVVAETAWLCNLLRELHSPLSTATLVYYDNISVVYMSASPVQHQQTKHIEIDIHFVRDMVTAGQVRILYVPSRYQYDDIFTKGLPSTLFEEF
nr:ribonuclease H-like domain-containing protein [Tanacetum cinerariifolium]